MTALDRRLEHWVVTHRVAPLDPFFEALTYLGNFGAVWLLAGAVLAIAWRQPIVFARVGVAALTGELASSLIKDVTERPRPPLRFPDPGPLVALPGSSSFPSGHATVAFACATVLAATDRRLAIPAFALAVGIAWSRVYVGVHYPLDVLAGAVLGVLLATALRLLGAALQRSRRARTPG